MPSQAPSASAVADPPRRSRQRPSNPNLGSEGVPLPLDKRTARQSKDSLASPTQDRPSSEEITVAAQNNEVCNLYSPATIRLTLSRLTCYAYSSLNSNL
jgi:hypothetical protein